MKYTTLGQTNIKVSKVCLGCMSFGKAGTMHDWTLDEKQTEEMVKHALDLGINFFDTANTYSNGTSEEYLGKALKNLNVKRLQTDYLDLYIIHHFDYDTPMKETMEALNELVNVEKYEQLVLLQCMDINFITCKSLLGTIIGLLFQLWKIITTYFIVKMKKN